VISVASVESNGSKGVIRVMARKPRIIIFVETPTHWVLKEQHGRGQNIDFNELGSWPKSGYSREKAQHRADRCVGEMIRCENDPREYDYSVDIVIGSRHPKHCPKCERTLDIGETLHVNGICRRCEDGRS
jgi:hypothetical protein